MCSLTVGVHSVKTPSEHRWVGRSPSEGSWPPGALGRWTSRVSPTGGTGGGGCVQRWEGEAASVADVRPCSQLVFVQVGRVCGDIFC